LKATWKTEEEEEDNIKMELLYIGYKDGRQL